MDVLPTPMVLAKFVRRLIQISALGLLDQRASFKSAIDQSSFGNRQSLFTTAGMETPRDEAVMLWRRRRGSGRLSGRQ